MKRIVAVILAVVSMVIASCSGGPPAQYDWCYSFNLALDGRDGVVPPFALANGYFVGLMGYTTDNNNLLSFSGSFDQPVYPVAIGVSIARASYGDISIQSAGTAFGIDLSGSGTLPESITNYELMLNAPAADTNSNTVNVSIQTSGKIWLSRIDVFGRYENPFGVSNCGGFAETPSPGPGTPMISPTPPTFTPSPWPTSLPSDTPTPPDATDTPTNTPSASPTPYTNEIYMWGGSYYPNPLVLDDVTGTVDIDTGIFTASNVNAKNPRGILQSGTGTSNADVDVTWTLDSPVFATEFAGRICQENAPTSTWSVYIDGVLTQTSSSVIGCANGVGSDNIGGVFTGGQWIQSIRVVGHTSGHSLTAVNLTRLKITALSNVPTPTVTGTLSPTPSRTPTTTRTLIAGGPTFTANLSATATRTPSRTNIPVQPPVTIPPVYYTATSGTAGPTSTATSGDTPTIDPSATEGTPVGTTTPYTAGIGTGTPVPGDFGDIGGISGGIFATVNNLFNIGIGWLNDLSGALNRITGAWYSALPQAPPGVPLCRSNPLDYEYCAILYILRWTFFAGIVGSLIMPLATIVFDIFIIFMFIRIARAILSRLAKVTQI